MKTIQRKDVANWIPRRATDTYKNKLGHILCIGGEASMGGAIILSAAAAVYSGAGLVTVASDPLNRSALHARVPEAMFVDFSEMENLTATIKKADVIIIGPGLGLSNQAEQLIKTILQMISKTQWLIIDGDALTLLSSNKWTLDHKQTVLTPHLGEWHSLTTIEAPATEYAKNKDAQEKLNAYVVLKKEKSEVYFEHKIWQNTAGNPSMATGGMGDTLTGIIASFLGQFHHKKQAILSAVYVHSAVADELAKTHYVTLPSRIIEELPIFINKLKN